MAQRTIIVMEDDLDGSEATQSISLTVNGVDYQLDLSDKNATKLHKALDPYLNAARRVGGRKRSNASKANSNGVVDNKAVRAWSASNGIELSSRGRIPATVIERYRAAGN